MAGSPTPTRLRHDYDTIDLSCIWLLIERDMPLLKAACQDALQALSLGKPPG
jgi:uncharacterized protein with HEPN domain